MHFYEDPLDEEFPLGDGTADLTAYVRCPYCGAGNSIFLDPGGGSRQEYVEDCQMCCRPWSVRIVYHGGTASVELETED